MKANLSIIELLRNTFFNSNKSLVDQITINIDPAHKIISNKEHKSELTLKVNEDLFIYFLKEDGKIYISAEYLGESEQEMCYLMNAIFLSDGIYYDNINQAIESVYYLLRSKGYKVALPGKETKEDQKVSEIIPIFS
jgi:hypothetical protein